MELSLSLTTLNYVSPNIISRHLKSYVEKVKCQQLRGHSVPYHDVMM